MSEPFNYASDVASDQPSARRRGPAPQPPEFVAVKVVACRVTVQEYQQIRSFAAASGTTISDWLRDVALSYQSETDNG